MGSVRMLVGIVIRMVQNGTNNTITVVQPLTDASSRRPRTEKLSRPEAEKVVRSLRSPRFFPVMMDSEQQATGL